MGYRLLRRGRKERKGETEKEKKAHESFGSQ
jgi:hypothetical protein